MSYSPFPSSTARSTQGCPRSTSRLSWRPHDRSEADGRARLLHVILPNLRAALLSAIVLTIALVMGEFTMAQPGPVDDAPRVDLPVPAERRPHSHRRVDAVAHRYVAAADRDRLVGSFAVSARPQEERGTVTTTQEEPVDDRSTGAGTFRPRGARVELDRLVRIFGQTRALDGFSLSIEPGEFVALLGSVGLRQDDSAAGACGLRTARRRPRGRRRQGPFASQRAKAGHGDGVPELLAVPEHERDQQRRLRPANATAGDRPSEGRRQPSCSSWSASETRRRSTPTRCPADNSSGSHLREPLPSSPGSSCSTSRSRRSTPRCAPSCATRSARCNSGSRSRRCSSPTTRKRRSRWPTGSA